MLQISFLLISVLFNILFLSKNHHNHHNNATTTTIMPSAQDKVTREWDAMAGEWDDMAAGYRDEFLKLLWQETEIPTEDRSGLVVLDFGCATGLLTEKLQSQVSKVIAMDVAPTMIQVLQDKIRAGDWKNVEAYCAVAAHLDGETKTKLEQWKGQVDVIAASSVLNFVPAEDLEATMQFLSGLLKPKTGILVHSDWPQGEEHPDGFTEEKALGMYQKGGLSPKTTKTINIKMSGYEMSVVVGVATKST